MPAELATPGFRTQNFSLRVSKTGIIAGSIGNLMAFDRNPKYGQDQSFSEGARRVADLLWETTQGDLTAFPKSYLENLRYEFSDGKVSMLELIDRVDLGPNATYEDYCEVIDALMSVNPDEWPNPDSVVEIPSGHLQYEIEPDYDFSEFDFADDITEEAMVAEGPEGTVAEEAVSETPASPQQSDAMSEKMELFFKKVISSVYLDGVTNVTDPQGNPPNAANNYLLSDDGKQFAGVFYDSPPNEKAKKFPFVISEKADGKWQIKY